MRQFEAFPELQLPVLFSQILHTGVNARGRVKSEEETVAHSQAADSIGLTIYY